MRSRRSGSPSSKRLPAGRCLFAGAGAILLGFPDTTQDADIFVAKDPQNGPFDLDLVFAPDGIERFEDAYKRHIEVEGFPVCHIDDIITSKEASGRTKDRESLPRLRAFREYWIRQNR